MLRRWCLPLSALAVAAASLAATGPAAAATMTGAEHHTAVPAHLPFPGHPMIPGGSHQVRPNTSNATVTSTNWSGYAAHGGTYRSVSANWTEPTVTCFSGSQYSAFWVGLDGYSSSTVEQDGSSADCHSGSPSYYAWYEMYPSAPVNFSNTVRPGDHFHGSVTYNGAGSYTLTVTDNTQGWTRTVNKTLSGAANSSAEVIVEAPCCTASGGPLPLADFHTVGFSSATVNGSSIGNFNPTEIIMVNSSGADKDTVSSLSGGTSFSATWVRSS
jgi:Peptidase A4 family